MNLYLDLFLTFARVGVCTFGGGYAMLPVLQREVVEKKGWATEEDLADYYAVGQCTPGVIAVNTATFVGYQCKGSLGGIVATLGVVSPSILIIGLIAAFLRQFAEIQWVAHAFAGVRACVCALILSSVLKLVKTAVVDWVGALLFAVVLILAAVSNFVIFPAAWGIWATVLNLLLSPVTLVLAAGAVGLAVRRMRGWKA